MTGPTFSPDGQWMWTGDKWIPAPPPATVVPQQQLDQQLLSSVATAHNASEQQLKRMAGYFDTNQDGAIDRYEMEQAAKAVNTGPTGAAPGFTRAMVQTNQAIQRGPQNRIAPSRQQPRTQTMVVNLTNNNSNMIIPFLGVGLIVISLFLPYFSVVGLLEYTGIEMMVEMVDLLSDVSDDTGTGSMDSGGTGTNGGTSGDEVEIDAAELALILAVFMFIVSPIVFSIMAMLASLFLIGGNNARLVGFGHMFYSVVFFVCAAASPSYIDVSVFDLLGIGFYMGAFSGILLLVK